MAQVIIEMTEYVKLKHDARVLTEVRRLAVEQQNRDMLMALTEAERRPTPEAIGP